MKMLSPNCFGRNGTNECLLKNDGHGLSQGHGLRMLQLTFYVVIIA